MRLRKWLLVVVALSFVIACHSDPPAAVMEYKGQTLVAIPVGDGNVLIIRAADAQFCPKGQGSAACQPRALTEQSTNRAGCPTCEGCNCRLPACSKYCLKAFEEYLDGHYTAAPPIPVNPHGPDPGPAPH